MSLPTFEGSWTERDEIIAKHVFEQLRKSIDLRGLRPQDVITIPKRIVHGVFLACGQIGLISPGDPNERYTTAEGERFFDPILTYDLSTGRELRVVFTMLASGAVRGDVCIRGMKVEGEERRYLSFGVGYLVGTVDSESTILYSAPIEEETGTNVGPKNYI